MNKDKNVAVRLNWDTWASLEAIRAERESESKTKTTLSDIVREAVNNYLGDKWNRNRHN